MLVTSCSGSGWPGAWRAVHWASYLLWPLAIIHGLGPVDEQRAAAPVGDDPLLGRLRGTVLAWSRATTVTRTVPRGVVL
ncbi:MAG: hypothetical protein U0Q08_05010 [Dermatophilaceae bacterium]